MIHARFSVLVAPLLVAITMSGSGSSLAAGLDPFDSEALAASSPGDSRIEYLAAPCRAIADGTPLSLADVVDQALCNNPQTRLAWANARTQAAQVGIAQSAYLPSLSASAGRSRVRNDSGGVVRYDQTTGGLSFNYLLFDFGGRAANLDSARQTMAALAATQDAILQSVFLAAAQAYYQWFAAESAIAAAKESERASLESLKAAEARYRIGAGTPADKLQAQTAASQATLARIQAEGNARTALGTLANAMGLDPAHAPALQAPDTSLPEESFERNLEQLIEAARYSRPDLVAAEADVRAARADIDVAKASGLPRISLSAAATYQDTSIGNTTRGNNIGLTLAVPLFSGFETTYRIRGAQAQLEAREARRDQLARQVALDVWRNYYALVTSTESVRASADLIASAEASAKMATGRYKAGVGGILDLLNAQSALASARQQNIQALYGWRIARLALAQAMGQLDFTQIPAK